MRASPLAQRRDDPATDAGAPTACPDRHRGGDQLFRHASGIGLFATTTYHLRFTKMVPDRLIPGTLNVGHAFPTFVQPAVYTQIIEVSLTTLVLAIAAARGWSTAGRRRRGALGPSKRSNSGWA